MKPFWEHLADCRREYLEQALREHGGSVMRAAAAAGLHRTAFYEQMKKAGVPVPNPDHITIRRRHCA